MARRRLARQVRQLLEDGEGDVRSVIVQMATPEEDRASLVTSATVALSHRALSSSARDCLPAERSGARAQTRAMPRPLLEPDAASVPGSLSAQLRTGRAIIDPKEAVQSARRQSLEHLAPLLDNDRVRVALERMGEHEGEDRSASLWAAGAVGVELSVEDLARLPEEIEGIEGVYANRRLRTPPVQVVHNIPEEVLENRVSSWGLEQIGALATWGAYGARGAGSTIAVLDTGVDASHPDLDGRVVGFAELDDQGGRVAAAEPHDEDGHGTHVCGTIAGGRTSGQWIGVAPEAKLVVGKVLGAQGGTDAQVLAGITWAIEQGVDAINMSLGGLVLDAETPPVYTIAILTSLLAGTPVITAIGNEGAQTTGLPGNDLFALAVGATDHLDRPAGFSGGRTQLIRESDFIDAEILPLPYMKPEVAAPGVAVVSSLPGGEWAALNGTSMAAPHVAGAVALLMSATGLRAVPAQERAFVVQDLLLGSVDELGEAGQDHRFGFGRLNVLKAIGFALERGLSHPPGEREMEGRRG
jgi:subtilisin family serine protease